MKYFNKTLCIFLLSLLFFAGDGLAWMNSRERIKTGIYDLAMQETGTLCLHAPCLQKRCHFSIKFIIPNLIYIRKHK